MDNYKPGQFLSHLWSLASCVVRENLLCTFYMKRLPRDMEMMFVAQDSIKLDKVAEITDKFIITLRLIYHSSSTPGIRYSG